MMLMKENVLDVVTQSISTTFHQALNRVSMVDGQIIRNGVSAVWNVDLESKQEKELALTLNLKVPLNLACNTQAFYKEGL